VSDTNQNINTENIGDNSNVVSETNQNINTENIGDNVVTDNSQTKVDNNTYVDGSNINSAVNPNTYFNLANSGNTFSSLNNVNANRGPNYNQNNQNAKIPFGGFSNAEQAFISQNFG
jgi:hypothetical protein